MNETMKLISDYGVVMIILAGIILLTVKYIPTLMNIWIDRLKTKNSSYDLLIEMQRNNCSIIENNSKVIENNTEAMKKSTEHYDRMSESLERLNDNICQHDSRAEQIAKDVAIIKERKSK